MADADTAPTSLPDIGTAEFFKALSDPNRLGILADLVGCCGEPKTVTEVAESCSIDLSVVSRHLATLRRAGLVAAHRRGREAQYHCCYDELVRVLRATADTIEACCPPTELSCCCVPTTEGPVR